MALTSSLYRIKIDMTYTSTGNANTAATSINNVLIAAGRPERAQVTSANVYLLIVGLSEAEGVTLKNSLSTGWSAAARSGGKVSLVRTNDLD